MKSLSSERKTVDKIDGKIAKLFVRRLKATDAVGEIKRAEGLAVCDEKREAEVITRVGALAGEYEEEIRELYKTVFSISKKRQEAKR